MGPPVVVVTAHEYRFDYLPVIPSGRVVFRVVNAGQLHHKLELLPLPEDLPPIDVQLKGSQRRVLAPFAQVPDLRPGERGTFAVDLAPGQRYAIICFIRDPDGRQHALEGMNSEFRAGAQPGVSGRDQGHAMRKGLDARI